MTRRLRWLRLLAGLVAFAPACDTRGVDDCTSTAPTAAEAIDGCGWDRAAPLDRSGVCWRSTHVRDAGGAVPLTWRVCARGRAGAWSVTPEAW